MYEKNFNTITVGELLQKVDISRGTFYSNFRNLDDVREQLIEDLFEQADKLCAGFKPSELAEDPYALMYMIADLMLQSRDPAKRIFKFINVYDLGVNLKTWLIKYILSDDVLVERMGGPEEAKIYARFIAGGVMHEYNMWITEDEFAVNPDLLARTLSNIVMGFFKIVSNLKACR